MIPIDEIISAIQCTRSEFAELFRRAQVCIPVGEQRDFEALVSRCVDAAAARRCAVEFASKGGFLDQLVDELVWADREDGTLRERRLRSSAQTATAHAIVDISRHFTNPMMLVRSLSNGVRWTCKVVVDGASSGTGVLVFPNMVLTAWHVVRRLFVMDAGICKPDPMGANRLQVQFDSFLFSRPKSIASSTPSTIEAHEKWCVSWSPCHLAEQDNDLPGDLNELDGHWDFAIIRLAKPVGLDRRWAELATVVPALRPKDRIYVFQHPAGDPLKIDMNDVVPMDPHPDDVSRLRFLHTANALGGSSGGPCFDKDFVLCGIHQGGWTVKCDAGAVVNRGIPAGRIVEHLRAAREWPPEVTKEESVIWRLDDSGDTPVFGCDEFQADLWRCVFSLDKRLLVIRGDSRAGKTFRTSIADALLEPAQHLKLWLDMPQDAMLDAQSLAALLCNKAGVALDPVLSIDATHSTRHTWAKDELLHKLIGALSNARGAARHVWLFLTDLNHCDSFGADTSELLYLLYGYATTVDWLRIVLDGMRGEIPRALHKGLIVHAVHPLERDDIYTYLKRRLNQLRLDHDDAGLRVVAAQGYRVLTQAPAGEALRELSDWARIVIDDYVHN